MRRSSAPVQRGSGWLELAIAALLLAILAAVLLDRLLAYQAMAERATLDLTIRNMRTGLRYHLASLIVEGRTREVAALPGTNPVRWLAHPPSGYLGEVTWAPAGAAPPAGHWWFDRGTGELAYCPAGLPGPLARDQGTVRLKITAGDAVDATTPLLGVSIAVAYPYHWP